MPLGASGSLVPQPNPHCPRLPVRPRVIRDGRKLDRSRINRDLNRWINRSIQAIIPVGRGTLFVARGCQHYNATEEISPLFLGKCDRAKKDNGVEVDTWVIDLFEAVDKGTTGD